MKAHVIAVINQKGGVGKSTTAHALAAGIALKGQKCLAVDLDAQRNLSYIYGANTEEKTILEVLTREAGARAAIQHTKNGDIIAASVGLAGADSFITQTGKEYRLTEALEEVAGEYEYIVIDTPPALGILTINALTASDRVVIPSQADIFSMQGIEQLAATIEPVKKYCNPRIEVDGILLTRFSARSILSREIAEVAKDLACKLNTKVFKAKIREGVAIKEAQISQKSIYEYAPKSKVAEDYKDFIDELLGDVSHGKKNIQG